MADEEDTSSSGSDFGLDEEETEIDEPVPESWLGYSWYVVRKAGRKTHKGEQVKKIFCSYDEIWYPLFYTAAIVYVGEKLAWYLGITSPDWQYAIDIHEDMQREEQEEREAEERALKEQEQQVLEALSQMEAANNTTNRTISS